MTTVIYLTKTNEIINITTDDIDISKLPEDQDACPISFFEQTDDGRTHLVNYYEKTL